MYVNENITISFSGNITAVKPGNYEKKYVQLILEGQNLINYVANTFEYREIYRNDVLATMKHQHWVPGILNGREMKLIFEVIKCYDNCLTCTEESTNESNINFVM